MKILDFNLDVSLVEENQLKLANIIRTYIFNSNESLLDLLDFDNDDIFLQPALFYYFFEAKEIKTVSLEQILLGFFNDKKNIKNIEVFSDYNSIIHLPNLGKIVVNEKNESFLLNYDSIENSFTIANNKVELILYNIRETSRIKISINTPEVFTNPSDVLLETIQTTTLKYYKYFEKALFLIKKIDTPLYKVIESVTKECFIFNSLKQDSFAIITYHGASFFNVENRDQDDIFFVEDIAHQCGHIIFNALTLNINDYLTIDKSTVLKDIFPNCLDTRSIYGIFHGLFTYTCILHCLDGVKTSSLITSTEANLIDARIGFYIGKFHMDLELLFTNKSLFTDKGLQFYDQFVSGYYKILNQYGTIIEKFNYSEQSYTFNTSIFIKQNNTI